MEIQKTIDSNHSELLALLKTLVDFLIEKEYSFFLVAGKDGVCSRYAFGDDGDVAEMINGMMEVNKDVDVLIKQIVVDKLK
jgi:hypothetical protein